MPTATTNPAYYVRSSSRNDPYPTRYHGRWKLLERRDPVIHGGYKSGPLTRQQLAQFESDGFILIESLFSQEEIRELRSNGMYLAEAWDDSPQVIREPLSRAVRSVFEIHRAAGSLAELCRRSWLRDAACQILGGEVYVHQSRINFKPGFVGQPFDWHSDFETWHSEDGMPRMRAVSGSLMLADNSGTNGALMLIPGSHHYFIGCPGETPHDHYKQSLKCQQVGVPPEDAVAELAQRHGIRLVEAPAGSLLLFDCNILHASAGNVSPYHRDNVFVVFNSIKNRLEAPFHGGQPRPEFLANRRVNREN
ncbi:ectoine hydroxylase [Acidihalobacter prosperus]